VAAGLKEADQFPLTSSFFHCCSIAALLATFSVAVLHTTPTRYVFCCGQLTQCSNWGAAGAGFSKGGGGGGGGGGRLRGERQTRFSLVGPPSYDPKAESDALDQAVQKRATGILWRDRSAC